MKDQGSHDRFIRFSHVVHLEGQQCHHNTNTRARLLEGYQHRSATAATAAAMDGYGQAPDVDEDSYYVSALEQFEQGLSKQDNNRFVTRQLLGKGLARIRSRT